MDKVTPLSIKELGLEDSEVLKGSLAIEEFLSLANRLISLSMYKEAIFLYELACKLNPENIALKINLSRIRELKKKADLSKIKELEEEIGRKRMKDDIVANHYIGLGYLHYRKGDIDKARDFFEMAKSRNKNFFIASLFLGKIHMGNNDIENAVAELEQARRANPFSEEVQSLLGKLYMEKGESQKSLEAYIDALILSGDPDLAKHPLYNQNIKNIFASLPDKGAKDVQAYIKERTQKFMDAAEVLERKKQEYMEGVKSQKLQSIFATHWEQEKEKKAILKTAASLRKFDLFGKLTDDELFQVAKLARTETFPKDQVIVHEDEAGDCIYLLDKGKVRVVRNTPFGEYCLSTYKKGRLFGEMNFIDDRHYSADVVALQETACYKFNNRELRELFETRKNIAVAFLWYFWSTLSQNIREMNEQMKEFFLQEALSQDRQIDEKRLAKAEKVIVDINKKLEAFRDKGLTPEETRVLASMSSEELFTKDGLIFTEGSPGNKLYIVLDGRVRITKQIPGVGEEALAILSRGDFFGEMALVDSAPRSADAKAHEGNATVLAIDKAVLDDVLHSNIDSAVQFLTIICKILSYRLREINDTLVKWKIMSGGF